ncbi:MAG: alanine:cation symporter family protein [Alteromonadaceae bacterium]|nr:alanine:cation symporter family protein [Alteromonadaceae bacterium]
MGTSIKGKDRLLNSFISLANDFLWNNLLIYLLVAAGIWFSFKLKYIQFGNFFHMFKLMGNSASADKNGISSFQALMTSLAARVGTGNLAGVAIAISLGGPGAIFWMWVIAFLGMATGFAESLLGQLYKVRNSKGEFRGGPAFYIKMGLNQPWLAFTFSLCIFIGYGLVFSSVQANTMADALNNAYQIEPNLTGLVIVILAGVILIGGVRAVAKVSSVIVPFMGLSYILLASIICLINIEQVPAVIMSIINSAFGLQEAGSGALGAAIINGIKRGLYSNEAGSGTVPHAAACASPNPPHPAAQGYVQMLGVFIDTIVICTATAMIILLALGPETSNLTGIRLTQYAMTEHVGSWGKHYVSLAICLFSFTSIIANYVYAENNLHLFKLDNNWGRWGFTLIFLSMTFWGTTAALPQVWALADLSLGVVTVINIGVILLLTPTIVAVTKDYNQQRKLSQIPRFVKKNTINVQGVLSKDVW